MKYATPNAFRTALEERLKNLARESGLSVARLRKTVAFEVLLRRLLHIAPEQWVLKGALALEFRIGTRTRTTRDVDLAGWDTDSSHPCWILFCRVGVRACGIRRG